MWGGAGDARQVHRTNEGCAAPMLSGRVGTCKQPMVYDGYVEREYIHTVELQPHGFRYAVYPSF